ncbi:MAG: hypothetical protein JRI99_05255, partial [Deltaproteobacteria bacterium]|nr:hypothetical protein [Deltaproteobacteria bacterium]
MQIDGHHTLTYIAARLAGFGHNQASIIAYSAQYVDDATNSGTIHFKNGAMYKRISSAHKMLDYRNTDELANHQVWIPFHFLPGYALHRLGIAMHVYADTWSHQGFSGVNHEINEVNDLESNNKKLDRNFFKKIASFFLSESFPLGHGAALSYPDRPDLIWKYKNGLDEPVERNNPEIFLEAVDKMCRAMKCFRKKDLNMDLDAVSGLPVGDAKKIYSLLKSIKDHEGEIRHAKWLAEIKNGAFTFGPVSLFYIAKGKGSWKYKSIGQIAAADSGREVFPYRKTFLKS